MPETQGRDASRSEPSLRLVPMSDAEREETLRRGAVDYANAKARAGFWTREESLTRARKEIAGLVGPDPTARGHAFYHAADAEGRRVGWVWVGPVPGSGPSHAQRWLFNIEVDAALRGRGLGRALLAALERHLLNQGVSELCLNVFRWNTVAVALYSSSGYEISSQGERNLEMRKRLGRS